MIAQLTAHLWQSTFFAIAAGLMTLAFRGNRAQVRYWLWLSASLKFFVPFLLLLSLGRYVETWAPSVHRVAMATPAISYTIEQLGQPLFRDASPPTAPAPVTNDWIPLAILGAWLCGFVATALMRFRNWLRIRAIVAASASIEMPEPDIPAPVAVRSSPGIMEPGVVGLIRPILLLPEGIAERLTPSELEAVLAHELCHVRRRDNLFASIHMVVEAVFWFHPLVWWIGARLVEERERACDEEVLTLGNRPDVYADAILSVCKLYVESPLPCVSGVTGAGIGRRIEAIMANRRGQKLNRMKKVLLAAAGAAILAGPLAIGIFHGSVAKVSAAPFAPQPQPSSFEVASFDVASVKPSLGPAKDIMFCLNPCNFGERLSVVGSRVDIRFMSLYNLVLTAYRIKRNRLSGPSWMQSQRFDIMAKIPDGASRDQVPEMLQALLSERFKLAIHRDRKDQPVFALVVGRSGLKLRRSAAEADAPVPEAPGSQPLLTPEGDARELENGDIVITSGPYSPMHGGRGSNGVMRWEFLKLTMPALAALVSPHVDRPVVDMTNLQGSYDFAFANQPMRPPDGRGLKGGGPPEAGRAGSDDTPADSYGEGMIRAVENAGLKLEPRKAPVEMIVVDRLEKTPTGN
jgi:bla regulator protein BlaR1